MRFIKEKFQKFDNKGLTLVELLCSVAILSVVAMVISSVLIVSADSYDRGNSETKVQQEAQLVANQIDDLLIDATADVDFDGSTLTIKQGTSEYKVVYDSSSHTLNYQETVGGTASESQLMASGVSSFNVDVADFAKLGYIKLDMTFERKSQTYPAVFTITARNKDTTAATEILAAIYLPNEVILEPWQTYDFYPTTSGLTNTSLNWSIVDATDSSTSLSALPTGGGYRVKVGENEMASTFKIKVTSVETSGGSPKAQKIVNVRVRRVNDIDLIDQFVSGTKYMAGATYNLDAKALGFNLNQAVGADYDTDYVDPFQMQWSIVSGGEYINVSANPSDSALASVVFTSEMPVGATVSVKATALHPKGTNKTGNAYGSPVEKVWTLMRIEGPLENLGGGWLRQSSQAQGRVKDSIVGFQQSVGGTRSEVFIRFKEQSGAYPKGKTRSNKEGDRWMPNIYGDGNDSRTINLRPLLTGLLEYNKDYDLQILLVVFDTNNLPVWPMKVDNLDDIYDNDGNLIWNLPADFPEGYYLQGDLERVKIGFKSDGNMLNLQPKADASGNYHGISKNTEEMAPTITAYRDQQFVLMEKYDVMGIDTTGTSVDNAINYILEKKQPDGTWKDVTNKDGFEVQKGSACRVTFRTSDYHGNYRVKVYVQDMKNWKLAANGKTIIEGNPPQIDYILYDEVSGTGIFYFNA